MTLKSTDKAALRMYLVDRFNLSEIKDLAFDLGVNYELFSHETLADFARELITYYDRRDQLTQLIVAVLERRPNKDLSQLVVELPASLPPTKVQIRVRADLLERASEQLKDLSSRLDVSTDEIELVAMASGSMRILVSLPERLSDPQILSKIILGDHTYQDTVLFDSLDLAGQKAWRLIACSHPPVREGDILRPTISWQAAIEATREAQSDSHRTSSEQLPFDILTTEAAFDANHLMNKPSSDFDPLDCYALLQWLERELRTLIVNELSKQTQKWWKQRVPSDTRANAETRKQEREKAYPGMVQQSLPVYDYLDFADYVNIITMKLNWDEIFKPIFSNQELVTVKLGEIRIFRNDVAHMREIPARDRELLVASVKQILFAILERLQTDRPKSVEAEEGREADSEPIETNTHIGTEYV